MRWRRERTFERAYTPVQHAAFAYCDLHGNNPTLSGMHDFSGNKVSPSQLTLATVLKQQGYATGAVIGSAVLDSRFGLNRASTSITIISIFNRLIESNLRRWNVRET